MKFFEYLAAGLPVVATAIDALGQFADASCSVLRNRRPSLPHWRGLSRVAVRIGRPVLRLRRSTLHSRTRRMLAVLEEGA